MNDKTRLTGWLFLLALCLAGCSHSVSKNNEDTMINWTKLPDLPGMADTASLGVSAPFAGVNGDFLLVAGGCNFPDKPVTEGGAKRYYADIFLLDLSDNDRVGRWKKAGQLPYPIAYGATVSTPEGILCVGGNNSDSSLTAVIRLSWDEQREELSICSLPDLPAPMDNLSATFADGKLYVAGGNENGIPCNTFLCLDLNKEAKTGWEVLPSFPGAARVQPVLAVGKSAIGTDIYLAGGFQAGTADIPPRIPSDLLVYHPTTKTWEPASMLPAFEDGSPRTFTGGCAVAVGDSSILLMGGVNYSRFFTALDRPRQMAQAEASGNQSTLDSLKAEAKAYMLHPVEWYKFNTSLLQYNTFTSEWTNRGEYEQLARAGAGAVLYKNRLIIVNGELKPGIRTSQVNEADL